MHGRIADIFMMIMKSYKFFLYAAAILPAAVSCDRSVLPGGDGGSDEVTGKIDIRTAVGPIVKSPQLGQDGSGNFVSGDMFRLTVSGEGFDDISEIYTVEETELFWSDLELPDNSGTVYFQDVILIRMPFQTAVSVLTCRQTARRIFCLPRLFRWRTRRRRWS